MSIFGENLPLSVRRRERLFEGAIRTLEKSATEAMLAQSGHWTQCNFLIKRRR